MRINHPVRFLGIASFGTLIATSSFAQDGGYPYVGLSIGQTRAEIDQQRIGARLLENGLTTSSMRLDEKDAAYKLFGGYQFNRYVALELGYFNLGEFGFRATTAPAGALDGRIKLRGVNLDLVATLPLTERLSALARVGVQSAKAGDTFTGTGAVSVTDPNPSERATNYKVGAGLQYAVTPSFWVRGEAERYRINDAVGNKGDVNMFSVSLVFPFGRSPTPAARIAAAPAYVAPAVPAPPPPVVVPAPPAPIVAAPPARRRVSFAAESLFTFDKSDLRPEGRAALDAFARELEGTLFDTITVEGHTDRLGADAYNQRLSTQRADAVKGYLISSGKVDAGRIVAVGKGESTPQTGPEDCKGNAARARLIACLQPDRRVEIEVVGTR